MFKVLVCWIDFPNDPCLSIIDVSSEELDFVLSLHERYINSPGFDSELQQKMLEFFFDEKMIFKYPKLDNFIDCSKISFNYVIQAGRI